MNNKRNIWHAKISAPEVPAWTMAAFKSEKGQTAHKPYYWNGINFSNKLIWYNGFLAVEAGWAWAGVILSKEIEMIHTL